MRLGACVERAARVEQRVSSSKQPIAVVSGKSEEFQHDGGRQRPGEIGDCVERPGCHQLFDAGPYLGYNRCFQIGEPARGKSVT